MSEDVGSAEPRSTPKFVFPRRSRYGASVITVLGGIALSLLLYLSVRDWERERAEEALIVSAYQSSALIKAEIRLYASMLQLMQRLHGSDAEANREDFAALAAYLLGRHPAIVRLSWVVRVPQSERESFERELKGPDGEAPGVWEFSGEARKPAGAREDHFVVQLEVARGSGPPRLGLDIASLPELASALAWAEVNGQVMLSGKERHTPDRAIVNLGLPVAAPGKAGEGKFSGVILEAVDVAVLVDDIFLANANFKQLDFLLVDLSAPNEERVVHASFPLPASDQQSRRRQIEHEFVASNVGEWAFEFGGRRWEMYFRPSSTRTSAPAYFFAKTLLAVGILLTTIITMYVLGLSTYATEIESLVTEVSGKNQQLVEADRQLQQKQEMLVKHEQELESAQRTANSVAKELRQPLTTLLLSLHLLDRERAQRDYDKINTIVTRAIETLKRLIQKLLDTTALDEEDRTEAVLDATADAKAILGPEETAFDVAAIASEGRRRILLVEDNEAIRRVLAKGLGDLPLDLDAAQTGEEALKKLASHEYDLVLTDISLPGISGIDVYLQTHEEKPDLKFLFMSGYPLKEEWLPIVEHGRAFLRKPFSIADVRSSLAGLLGET